MTTHIMTDTETLGTRPGAIVLSVALVRFTDEAHTSINLSIPDQEALGLVSDPATCEWWHRREAETPGVWAAATANALPLANALEHIRVWLEWATWRSDWLIWCQGANFDCPLLEE